jgi:hypothetical protein
MDADVTGLGGRLGCAYIRRMGGIGCAGVELGLTDLAEGTDAGTGGFEPTVVEGIEGGSEGIVGAARPSETGWKLACFGDGAGVLDAGDACDTVYGTIPEMSNVVGRRKFRSVKM